MNTLWDLVDRPLAYHSRETVKLTEGVGVTLPGPSAIQVPEEWRADRCVRDTNLLQNMRRSCQALLEQHPLSLEINSLYDHVVQVPHPPMGHSMNNEEDVKAFLGEHWLQGVEVVVKEVLRQKGVGGSFEFVRGTYGRSQIPDWFAEHRGVCRSLVEGKAETVMNAHLEKLLERADDGSEIVWGDHISAGAHTANLLYKVAIYLGTYRRTWLCLTSLSCMLVFRLVRRSGGRPYLIVSDPVFVPDRAERLTVVADERQGRDWIPTVVSTCLYEIASDEPGLSFAVTPSPVPIGEPAPPPEGYPASFLSEYSSGSETETSHSDNSSDETYRSTSSMALVFFADKGGNPRGLSALLILSTPSLSTPLSLAPPQSRPFILEVDARRSSLPKLKLTNEIGRGSTGQVFNAQWHAIDVVAKISWDSDARKRLEMEAARYISLIEQSRVPQERIQRALPLFLGWYRGHSFDLMILTAEGQSCEGENWKSLSRNQLYDLYSNLHTLHEAGLLHGDVHPRNTLVARNDQVRLVDLTEASEHKCPESRKLFPMMACIGPKRSSSPHKCAELKRLYTMLGLKTIKPDSTSRRSTWIMNRGLRDPTPIESTV